MSLAAQLYEAIDPLFEGKDFVDTTANVLRPGPSLWAYEAIKLIANGKKVFIKDPDWIALGERTQQWRFFDELRKLAVTITHDAETYGAGPTWWDAETGPYPERDAAIAKDMKGARMSLKKVSGKTSEGWLLQTSPSIPSIWRKNKTWAYT